MKRELKTAKILLTIRHTEKATDLIDKAAGRVYTVDGVEDVTAELFVDVDVSRFENPSIRQRIRWLFNRGKST